ncbi:hypothetical protein HanHA89_Chr15g0630871 [Helianthus annuus]|nr:hypothetical protein HanHA89_Chr15g0630871 [Helianthus annuus]
MITWRKSVQVIFQCELVKAYVIHLPVSRFELGCMPPRHPTPRSVDAADLDYFDVVYFHDRIFICISTHPNFDDCFKICMLYC